MNKINFGAYKMRKKQALVKLSKNKIDIDKAYEKLYKIKRAKKARYVKMKILIPDSKGVRILVNTLFLLPMPIWLLKIFFKNSDQVISEEFPVKIKDFLKQGLYKGMSIKVNSNDGTKIIIKTI